MDEFEMAFQQLKEYLGSPPLLTVPNKREKLILYMSVSLEVSSGPCRHGTTRKNPARARFGRGISWARGMIMAGHGTGQARHGSWPGTARHGPETKVDLVWHGTDLVRYDTVLV